jgi:hypothetical protein
MSSFAEKNRKAGRGKKTYKPSTQGVAKYGYNAPDRSETDKRLGQQVLALSSEEKEEIYRSVERIDPAKHGMAAYYEAVLEIWREFVHRISIVRLGQQVLALSREEQNIIEMRVRRIDRAIHGTVAYYEAVLEIWRESVDNRRFSIHHDVPMTMLTISSGRYNQHSGVKCDVCNGNVHGVRFHCTMCPDFDMCQDCFLTTDAWEKHKDDRIDKRSRDASAPYSRHLFLAIQEPEVSSARRSDVANLSAHVHSAGPSSAHGESLPCTNCGAPILGFRYTCQICPNVHLCTGCDKPGTNHPIDHPMLRVLGDTRKDPYSRRTFN